MKIDSIASELAAAGRRKILANRVSLAGLCLSLAALALAAMFALDYLTRFPSPVRIAMTICILGFYLFYLPWRRRNLLGSGSNLVELAREVESRAESGGGAGLRSTLVSAVEFASNPSISGLPIFKQKTVEKAHGAEFSPTRVPLHDHRTRRHSIHASALAVLIYAGLMLSAHDALAIFLLRALGLQARYPTRTRIAYVDCPLKSAQHKDILVKTRADGIVPSSGRAKVAYDGEDEFGIPLEAGDSPGCFQFKLKSPMKSLEFQIQIGDATSDWIPVQIICPPSVKDGVVRISPPEYTGTPASESPVRDLEFIEKSNLAFSIVPDRDVEKCVLEIKDASGRISEYPMQKSSSNSYGIPKLSPKDATAYAVRLVDKDQIENSGRIFYSINILPDRLPSVAFEKPADGSYYSPASRMGWSAKASDDYGLRELVMTYKTGVQGESGEIKIVRQGSIGLAKMEGQLGTSLSGGIELAELDLKPGMVLSIQMAAKDKSPFREDSEMGRSQTRTMNIVSPAELKEMINSELILVGKMVEDIHADMKRQVRIINLQEKSGGAK